MKKALRISAILALAAFAACNTIVQPQQSNPGDFNVDFTNTDGTPTYFDAANASAYNDGSTYRVIGTASNYANVTVSGIPASASVPYTTSTSQTTGLTVQYHDPSNNRDYTTSSGSGSCTITISQTSPTLTGTFTARLVNRSFDDSVRVVTSATFNAVLK
jgi:hypothetical protein